MIPRHQPCKARAKAPSGMAEEPLILTCFELAGAKVQRLNSTTSAGKRQTESPTQGLPRPLRDGSGTGVQVSTRLFPCNAIDGVSANHSILGKANGVGAVSETRVLKTTHYAGWGCIRLYVVSKAITASAAAVRVHVPGSGTAATLPPATGAVVTSGAADGS